MGDRKDLGAPGERSGDAFMGAPSTLMPAISLWQPWGSLWLAKPRLKYNETRHWALPRAYLGRRVLVHAAKTTEGIRDAQDDGDLNALCIVTFGSDWASTLPRGGFIGSVLLSACERMTSGSVGRSPEDFMCGNWAPGRFSWLGEDPEAWPLIPARGQQGFWMAERPTSDAVRTEQVAERKTPAPD